MTLPESNLPPNAQQWRRAIEGAITELQSKHGATETNLKATRNTVSGVATRSDRIVADINQAAEDIAAVAEVAESKDESAWQPKPPDNPHHNQRWFDITDGNVLRVWIDYGGYERINYIPNPSFTTNTAGWTAANAVLGRSAGIDPAARLTVESEDVVEVVFEETAGRTVTEILPPSDDEGEGDDGSGAAGEVGVPWSAGLDLRVVSGNPDVIATLEVVNGDDLVIASSGTVVPTLSGEPIRVLAAAVAEEYTISPARVRLRISGLSAGDTVYVDKVMLEPVVEMGDDYFDGDMPGVEWATRLQGRVSVWGGEPAWHELQDVKALRIAAQDAFEQLGLAFETSEAAPTPADGEGRPNNAAWTQINSEGEQVARWRWNLADEEWVPEPLGVEIIPEAYIDYLVTNEAFMSQLVLSEEADGWLTRVTGRGIEIFDSDDMPVSRYGAFSENALNFYENGNAVASISDAGVVTGREGSFDTLDVGGTDIAQIVDEFPRGVIYDRNFPLSRRITTLGGHTYIVFDAYQGRQYKVTCRVTLRNIDSKGAYVRFYHTSANLGQPLPGEPSVAGGNNSTQTAQGRTWYIAPAAHGSQFTSHEISFTYSAPGTVDKTVALLNGFEPFDPIGNGQLEIGSSWWTVEDIGRTGTGSGGSYSISGGGSSGGGSNPEPEQPKRRYTRRYNSTEWRTFQNVTGNNTGSRTTSVSGPTQGYTPYYPSAGQYASHYYFNSGEIQADLAGATVISARVRITCTHSHANSGGTARIHTHGHGPSGNWGSPTHRGDTHFAKGQSKWLGVSYDGWRTGSIRGIGLWSRGNSTNYYMRFGTSAVLEITYER